MTEDTLEVPDSEAFETLLAELVQTAHRNGVSVDGGWEVNGPDGTPDWDVVVTVVERAADD